MPRTVSKDKICLFNGENNSVWMYANILKSRQIKDDLIFLFTSSLLKESLFVWGVRSIKQVAELSSGALLHTNSGQHCLPMRLQAYYIPAEPVQWARAHSHIHEYH